MRYKYIKTEKGVYVGKSLEMKGVISEAMSLEELEANLEDATKLMIEAKNK